MDTVGECIRVLVVEDEESYRQALSSGLRREGFDVDVAPDGLEGLASEVGHLDLHAFVAKGHGE